MNIFYFYLNLQYQLVLRPIWDWAEQFSDRDIALFTNPLYKKPPEQQNTRRPVTMMLPSTAVPLPGLHNPTNDRIFKNMQRQNSSPTHTEKPLPEVNMFICLFWAFELVDRLFIK